MTPAGLARVHAAAFGGTGQVWSAEAIAALQADATVTTVEHAATGFALLRVLPPEAEILTLAVHPQARGQGVGTTLVAAALDRAAASGCSRVFLEVDEENPAARAVYAKSGFEEVGRRRAYYAAPDGTRSDALILSRAVPADYCGSGGDR